MRLLLSCCLALVVWSVTACSNLPSAVDRRPSTSLAAPADAPLVRLAGDSGVPAGLSGFWPMPTSAIALDARLALIRMARSSLDLQYYLIGNDGVGQLILRELRDAARRGVRVRLLVDDFHTQGLDPLLQGLEASGNVQVRLFNPFASGRHSGLARLVSLLGDFRRLNHRMHNKLFIADGAVGVVGGRNLADEYFLRGQDANFIDMDLVVTGALMGELNALYDSYWNSDQVFPLDSVVERRQSAESLQSSFDAAVANGDADRTGPLGGTDAYGAPPLSAQLGAGTRVRLVMAESGTYADAPAKASTGSAKSASGNEETVSARFASLVRTTQREVIIFSPYFIPGRRGIDRLRELRARGIDIRVITNATATSDEPLANLGYERYREEMLRMGVRLYELSATRLARDPQLGRALGSSRGRLHAKMAFLDRNTVLVGSMNLDPRSAHINTEIGVSVRSRELAQMILAAYHVDRFDGAYEARLRPDGQGVQWVGRDAEGEETFVDEPEMSAWQRFRLWLMSFFLPEGLL